MTPRTRVLRGMPQAGARSWDKIPNRSSGQAPTPHQQSTLHCKQRQLDSAAMHMCAKGRDEKHVGVRLGSSRESSMEQEAGGRRQEAEWTLNAGEGSSGAAGVRVT